MVQSINPISPKGKQEHGLFVFSKETSQTIKEDLINVIADEKGTGHSNIMIM